MPCVEKSDPARSGTTAGDLHPGGLRGGHHRVAPGACRSRRSRCTSLLGWRAFVAGWRRSVGPSPAVHALCLLVVVVALVRTVGSAALGDGLVRLSGLQHHRLRLERGLGLPAASTGHGASVASHHAGPRGDARHRQYHAPVRDGHLGRPLQRAPAGWPAVGFGSHAQVVPRSTPADPAATRTPMGTGLVRAIRRSSPWRPGQRWCVSWSSSSTSRARCASTTSCSSGPPCHGCGPIRAGSIGAAGVSRCVRIRDIVVDAVQVWWRSPQRLTSATGAARRHGRHFFGLDSDDERRSEGRGEIETPPGLPGTQNTLS